MYAHNINIGVYEAVKRTLIFYGWRQNDSQRVKYSPLIFYILMLCFNRIALLGILYSRTIKES